MIYNMTKVLPRDALTKFSASCKLFFSLPLSISFSFFMFCRDAHISFMRRKSSRRRRANEEKVWTRCNRSIKSLTVELRRCQRPIQTFKCNVRWPPSQKKYENKNKTALLPVGNKNWVIIELCFEYVYERALKRPHIVRDWAKTRLPCASSIGKEGKEVTGEQREDLEREGYWMQSTSMIMSLLRVLTKLNLAQNNEMYNINTT